MSPAVEIHVWIFRRLRTGRAYAIRTGPLPHSGKQGALGVAKGRAGYPLSDNRRAYSAGVNIGQAQEKGGGRRCAWRRGLDPAHMRADKAKPRGARTTGLQAMARAHRRALQMESYAGRRTQIGRHAADIPKDLRETGENFPFFIFGRA